MCGLDGAAARLYRQLDVKGDGAIECALLEDILAEVSSGDLTVEEVRRFLRPIAGTTTRVPLKHFLEFVFGEQVSETRVKDNLERAQIETHTASQGQNNLHGTSQPSQPDHVSTASKECAEETPRDTMSARPSLSRSSTGWEPLVVHVELAVSGLRALTARMAMDSTVADLKAVICRDYAKRGEHVLPHMQTLVAGNEALLDCTQLLSDVLSDQLSEGEPGLVGLAYSPADELFDEVVELRKKLSMERNPPIQDVIDAGEVPRLVSYLREDSWPQLQFEAAWVLANIASGDHTQTQAVVDNGAVQLLIRLLASPNDDVRDQSLWALGNISGDGPEYRDLCLEHDVLPATIGLLHFKEFSSIPRTAVCNACWAMSNFCRGRPAPSWEHVRPALPEFMRLLDLVTEPDALSDCCWGLSYIADQDPEERFDDLGPTLCNRAVTLLMNQPAQVQTPALRVLGNLATGDVRATQWVIDSGLLDSIMDGEILRHRKEGIRKEACWIISNIAAGSREQVQSVLNSRVVPSISEILLNEEESMTVKKEALFVFHNILSGDFNEEIDSLVRQGCASWALPLVVALEPRVRKLALEIVAFVLLRGKAYREQAGGGARNGSGTNTLPDSPLELEGVPDRETVLAAVNGLEGLERRRTRGGEESEAAELLISALTDQAEKEEEVHEDSASETLTET